MTKTTFILVLIISNVICFISGCFIRALGEVFVEDFKKAIKKHKEWMEYKPPIGYDSTGGLIDAGTVNYFIGFYHKKILRDSWNNETRKLRKKHTPAEKK